MYMYHAVPPVATRDAKGGWPVEQLKNSSHLPLESERLQFSALLNGSQAFSWQRYNANSWQSYKYLYIYMLFEGVCVKYRHDGPRRV